MVSPLIVDFCFRLELIRRHLGIRVLRLAVQRASVAIAGVVHEEALRRAAKRRPRRPSLKGTVVPFPADRIRPPRGTDGDGRRR